MSQMNNMNHMRLLTKTAFILVSLSIMSSCSYMDDGDDRPWFASSKETMEEKFVKRRMPRDNKGGEGIFLDSLPENRRPVPQHGIKITPEFAPLTKHSNQENMVSPSAPSGADMMAPPMMPMIPQGMDQGAANSFGMQQPYDMQMQQPYDNMPHDMQMQRYSSDMGKSEHEEPSFFKKLYNKMMGNETESQKTIPFPDQYDAVDRRRPMQQPGMMDSMPPYGASPTLSFEPGMNIPQNNSFNIPPADKPMPDVTSGSTPAVPMPYGNMSAPAPAYPFVGSSDGMQDDDGRINAPKPYDVPTPYTGDSQAGATNSQPMPMMIDNSESEPSAPPVSAKDVVVLSDEADLPWLEEEQESNAPMPMVVPSYRDEMPAQPIDSNILPWKEESASNDVVSDMPIQLINNGDSSSNNNYPELATVPQPSNQKDFEELEEEINTLIKERDSVKQEGHILFAN